MGSGWWAESVGSGLRAAAVCGSWAVAVGSGRCAVVCGCLAEAVGSGRWAV